MRLTMLPAICAAVLVNAMPAAAYAATLTFDLNVEFSGATEPESATLPWLTAVFDDSFGGASTVRLSMTTSNLTDAEWVDEWLFNFDPALDPNDLSFALFNDGGTGVVVGDASTTAILDAAFKADGDGFFDIKFDFPNAPPPDRFTGDPAKTVIFDITHASLAIDVSSFDFLSAPGGGQGSFKSAAHIQSIGPSDEDSGWIGPGTVPEPASLWLLGLVALAALRRSSKTH